MPVPTGIEWPWFTDSVPKTDPSPWCQYRLTSLLAHSTPASPPPNIWETSLFTSQHKLHRGEEEVCFFFFFIVLLLLLSHSRLWTNICWMNEWIILIGRPNFFSNEKGEGWCIKLSGGNIQKWQVLSFFVFHNTFVNIGYYRSCWLSFVPPPFHSHLTVRISFPIPLILHIFLVRMNIEIARLFFTKL